ncbi:hypothetical protein SAMN05428989_3138 [Pseudoxanthomonas sp. GM95]|nr:hypothetical protein SAMN05428989_3138 [Pseudoxanthomonas sp. GM95]
MTALYLLCGLLAALGFYLATAHQQLRPALRRHARLLRLGAWWLALATLLAAIQALGPWAGGFAALTVVMLGLVALPYADAWWQQRSARRGR